MKNVLPEMMKFPRFVVAGSLLLLTCWPLSAQLASVNWGAQNTYGLGTSDGTELAVGSLVRIGSFSLSDSQILQNQGDLNFLNSHFVEFGHAAVGDDVGVAGHWNAVSVGSTDGLGISNQRIYLWAFDSPALATAAEHGIFSSASSAWQFPANSAVPNTTSIDIEQVLLNEIQIGSFGTGTSSQTEALLYNLVPIPEPAAAAPLFGLFCLVTIALRRRFGT